MSQELLGLHNLQKNPKARKRKIRRGRGNASGHGNYSGRGMKGQKSRSGASGLKLRGVKAYMQRIPKKKGFKSGRPSNIPINLAILDKYFGEGEVVSLRGLVKKNLIPTGKKNVKILASGVLTKKLVIRINNLSAKAKEAIIKAGGEVDNANGVHTNATNNTNKEKKIEKGRAKARARAVPKTKPANK